MKEQTKAAAAPGFEERLSLHETMVLAWQSLASRDSANPGRHPSNAPLQHELAIDIGGVADAMFDGIADLVDHAFARFADRLVRDVPLHFTAFHPGDKMLLDAAYSSGINTAYVQQTTGIQNLRVSDYLNTHVAVPSLPEQQRITAYLDESCSAIDAAVAAKRRQFDTLYTLRKAIIQRAITRGISGRVVLEPTGNAWMERIPRGWRLVCLKRASLKFRATLPSASNTKAHSLSVPICAWATFRMVTSTWQTFR